MQQRELPIGVFDSGIGGLTVASAIRQVLPGERIFYFGDTARCPYGDRQPEEVVQFSVEVCDFLYESGVKMLVVACNTATSAGLSVLEQRYSIPVIGVIQPGAKAAVQASSGGEIGVIGTALTVQSGAYARAIKERAPDANVFSVACPAFVPLVERGEWEGENVERTVRAGLAPLAATNIDTLILGCTHYPHLQSTIQHVMGAGVKLISSAHETALEVARVLAEGDALARGPEKGADCYFATGSGSKMRLALSQWMNVPETSADLRTLDGNTFMMRPTSAH